MIGDIILCIKTANQFYDIARCIDKGDIIDGVLSSRYPFAANITFTCELYLKALIISESNDSSFSRGHDLLSLFEMLPQRMKTSLERSFEDHFGGTKKLYTFLESQKKIFENWRYPFELVKDDEKGIRFKVIETLDYSGFVIFASELRTAANNLLKKQEI